MKEREAAGGRKFVLQVMYIQGQPSGLQACLVTRVQDLCVEISNEKFFFYKLIFKMYPNVSN